MYGLEHAKGFWKKRCLVSQVVAHTCDGRAMVLFILGEEPSQDQIEAGGPSDGGIGMITKQLCGGEGVGRRVVWAAV